MKSRAKIVWSCVTAGSLCVVFVASMQSARAQKAVPKSPVTVSKAASASKGIREIPAPAATPETPLKIVARAKASYLPGLPIRVTVEVTNTSKQTIETVPPSVKFDALAATVRREGDKTDLQPSRHQHHVFFEYPTIQIQPGETVRNQLDVSLQFQDSLPPGRYTCEVRCSVGQTLRETKLLRAKPVSIIIDSPALANRYYERERHLTMNMFLGALALMGDPGETYNRLPGNDLARQLFSYIVSCDANGEYGKVSAFYRAQLEGDPKRALAAWQDCLKITDVDPPNMIGPDDIWRNIGLIHYESGDFKAAKEALLKVDKSDEGAQFYLKKIEAGVAPVGK